jgi:acyl carrier protein
MKKKVVEIINEICETKGYPLVNKDHSNINQLKLREDIGLDSLDLAQLTVFIEEEFDIDIFEDGVINTIGEVLEKLKHA